MQQLHLGDIYVNASLPVAIYMNIKKGKIEGSVTQDCSVMTSKIIVLFYVISRLSQATNSLLYSIVVVNVNVAQKLTDQLKPSYCSILNCNFFSQDQKPPKAFLNTFWSIFRRMLGFEPNMQRPQPDDLCIFEPHSSLICIGAAVILY